MTARGELAAALADYDSSDFLPAQVGATRRLVAAVRALLAEDGDQPRVGDRLIQEGEPAPGTVLEVETNTVVRIAWDDGNEGASEWIDLKEFSALGLSLVGEHTGGPAEGEKP